MNDKSQNGYDPLGKMLGQDEDQCPHNCNLAAVHFRSSLLSDFGETFFMWLHKNNCTQKKHKQLQLFLTLLFEMNYKLLFYNQSM